MKPSIQIEYRPLSELKKLEDNPRTIKKKDFETLKKSVQDNPDYFEARPLILSDRTGELVIIAGNMRYEAAKAIGMEQVPTVTLHGLTEERERESSSFATISTTANGTSTNFSTAGTWTSYKTGAFITSSSQSRTRSR